MAVKKIEKPEETIINREEKKDYKEPTLKQINEGVPTGDSIQETVDSSNPALSKEDTMDRIKKIIRNKFSDYNKLSEK